MRYRSKRQYIWSENIAYAVGLIASDGCLQSDGRHLDLTSADIEQLENFIKAIGRPLKITKKFNSSGQPASRVQFGDVAFYDFLLNAGITPRKSSTLQPTIIPDRYYADFLRGLFDGDGTCYGYNDPRWPTSFLFYTGFTSASKKFLEYICEKNYQLILLKGSSIRKSSRAYSLMYGKSDSYLLYKFLYYNSSVLCLNRKKQKLEGFMQKDLMVESKLPARVVKSVNT
ncbi:MAG TPA: LAGLIDADG family homing endonuclease [Patescibacteria group bacterium]|nr:LAGLIDADG family homing endonuclease [Patescibacteria group bacterium]